MPQRIKVANLARCIGCYSCMLACSRQRGLVSLVRSAIQVKTRGGIEGDFILVVCHACEDPPCAHACQPGALEKADGGVKFDRELCTRCGACKDACLIGAITMDQEEVVVCKHCGMCAEFCPHDVLTLEVL